MLRLGYELLLIWLVWIGWSRWHEKGWLLGKLQCQGKTRQRHPQSPRDCPICRAAHGACAGHEQPVVEAWYKQKSKRGRPKVIPTEGYCCPNPRCRYYGITDARVHALVGDGYHYGADTI